MFTRMRIERMLQCGPWQFGSLTARGAAPKSKRTHAASQRHLSCPKRLPVLTKAGPARPQQLCS